MAVIDSYIESRDHPRGWFGPRSDVHVLADDRGFVLGDGVYEVVRGYHGRWFRIEHHLARLERSLRETRIALDSVSRIEDLANELLCKSQLGAADVLLYVQVTRGAAPRTHAFPDPPVAPTVYMTISKAADYTTKQAEGVAVVTLGDFRWHRCDVKTISLQANVLAMQHARDSGADEVLFIRNGVATEGGHSNFFGVTRGVVRTHPVGPEILSGVTRACVMELCAKARIPVREEPVAEDELQHLDEAFLTATSWEIVPVIRIDAVPIHNSVPGPLTRTLQALFRKETQRTQ